MGVPRFEKYTAFIHSYVSSAPHNVGHVSAIPAPSMASPGPFKDAGLECSDLIYLINGDHLGPDGAERWWKQAAAAGGGAVGGGRDSSAMAGTRRVGGKRRSGRFTLVREWGFTVVVCVGAGRGKRVQ